MPADRYVVEAVDDEAAALSQDEEAGIEAVKVTYTEEAIADIVDAISYLNERNPTAAAISTSRSRSASSV